MLLRAVLIPVAALLLSLPVTAMPIAGGRAFADTQDDQNFATG
jgi:hypothetical protein